MVKLGVDAIRAAHAAHAAAHAERHPDAAQLLAAGYTPRVPPPSPTTDDDDDDGDDDA